MNIRTAGTIAAILLAIPLSAAAETADAATPTRLAIRTFNYYGISAKDLEIARIQAQAILGDVGIEVVWLDCAVERNVMQISDPCTQTPGATDLLLRIGAANQRAGTRSVSMGFSLVNSLDGKAPYLATIYADRVTSVAREAGIDMRELFGRAIAHEIGHLLLGSNQHASAGLMRATWSLSELRRDRPSDWHFKSDEAEKISAALAERQSTR